MEMETERREKSGRRREEQEDLPEEIMQYIQSLIPVNEAARTSSLSKAWLHAWSTIPILRLHRFVKFHGFKGTTAFCIPGPGDCTEIKRSFVEFADKTLERYVSLNLPVESLELEVESSDVDSDSYVDKLVKLATKICSKELSLSIRMKSKESYMLPKEIFSGETLRMIKLVGHSRLHISPNSMIKCFSLVTLELCVLEIDVVVLDTLFTNCVLLEKISLKFCRGFERIHVGNLHHLKEFNLIPLDNQSVEINAPTLRSFFICDLPTFDFVYTPKIPRRNFNIDASKNLICLVLDGLRMGDLLFNTYVSKFPLLEDLKVANDNMLESIRLFCVWLKKLSLCRCNKLMNVKVYSSNMLCLRHTGSTMPRFSLPNIAANQLKAYIGWSSFKNVDESYFLHLREVIIMSRNVDFSISFDVLPTVNIDLHGLRAYSDPPKNVVDLKLGNLKGRTVDQYSTFLEACFMICRPMNVYTYWNELFSKFLFAELMERGNRGCCTFDDQIRCWERHLKDVKVWMLKEEDKYEPLSVPWTSLLDGSTKIPESQYIKFEVTW